MYIFRMIEQKKEKKNTLQKERRKLKQQQVQKCQIQITAAHMIGMKQCFQFVKILVK